MAILLQNFLQRRMLCGALTLAAALALAGCSSSLNHSGELTSGLPAADLPARSFLPKAASSVAAPEQRTITGFRNPMIIIFSAQGSHDGERISTSTMTVPLKARQLPGHPDRLEIMTVYGPRWIAASEVLVEPASGL